MPGIISREELLADATPEAVAPTHSTVADDIPEADRWREAVEASALSLADIDRLDIPPRQSIIAPWFCEGDLGFIFAPRGTGKTWKAMLLTLCVTNGHPLGPWRAADPRTVVYVDGEMAIDSTLERFRALMPHAGGDPGERLILLHHEPMFHLAGKVLNLTSPVAQDAVTRLCVERGVSVLVLDNLSCLLSIKENDADPWGAQVLPWLLELRRKRIAVVFVAHAGRNGAMRGTSRREDAAFWIMRLSDSNDADAGHGARFLAAFEKNRNGVETDCPPLQWEFEPDHDGGVRPTWKKCAPLQVLVDLVNHGLTRCGEIAEEMGKSKGYISKLAKLAQEAGHITISSGNYTPRDVRS